MERGLSSESNSVSSPPTPSDRCFLVFHLKPSTFIDTGCLQGNWVLVVGHNGDVVGALFVDLQIGNSC